MKAKTMVVVTTLLVSSGLVLAAGDAQELNADHPGSTGGTNQDAPTTLSGGMPMMPMHARTHAEDAFADGRDSPDQGSG